MLVLEATFTTRAIHFIAGNAGFLSCTMSQTHTSGVAQTSSPDVDMPLSQIKSQEQKHG